MRRKPGRPARKVAATQRRRLMRGIAIGLTLEQLASDINMPLGTMRRTFAAEIKTARTKLILDNLDRLHAAADAGNVSAMKTLALMMRSSGEPEHVEEHDDQWADVVGGQTILSRNAGFH
jgi:hypothetical protein